MTNRVKGFVVVLDKDIREDGMQSTINAIKMVKGVVRAEPITCMPHEQQIIELRVKEMLRGKLDALIDEIRK